MSAHETNHRTHAVRLLMILMVVPVAIGFLIAVQPPADAVPQDFDRALDQARAAYDQGNYEDALKLYKRANAMNKDNVECLVGMALTFNKLGQYKNTLKISDQLIAIRGADAAQRARAWNLRGNTLFEAALNDPKGVNEKNLRDAEAAFREVLKISPNLNLAHYNLGTVLMRMNRMDEGLGELRAYLKYAQEPETAEKARMIVAVPKIPIPELEVVDRRRQDYPDGYRNSYTLRIKNWSDFPNELFRIPRDFPPCYMGAPVNTRVEIVAQADEPPDFPIMCAIAQPEGLRYITVSSQLVYKAAAGRLPKQKKIRLQMRDRLTGNIVFSNAVPLP